MSASVVVKNTFICVVEDKAVMSPTEGRGRAETIDVATLGRQAVLIPCVEDEEEAMTKCLLAPETKEANEVASLAAALDAGGAAADQALDAICRSVCLLAFDAAGSALVLRALEVARASEVRVLADGLRGMVGEAARSSSACRVLEQIVCCLGIEDAAFIAEELLAHNPWNLVLNANGSSILCRLIEYSSADARTLALVDAVLSGDVGVLCSHKCGYEVAMSILSNGSASQRSCILAALRRDVQRFARHRFASKVVEQALALCPEEEQESLALEVLARPSTVVALACHSFGVNVVRELLQVSAVSQQVQLLLAKSSGRVRRDKFGSELVRQLGMGKQQPKQVWNFTTHGLGPAEHAVYEAAVVRFVAVGA